MKTIKSFVILLILLTIKTTYSDWQPTSFNTGNISSIAGNEARIFIISGIVLYSTSNGGLNWLNSNNTCNAVGSSDSYFFAAKSGNAYMTRTTNNGTSWHNTGIINADGWFSIATSGSNIFASRYVIQRSTNSGESWTVLTGISSAWLECMAANGTLVFALKSHAYLYRSTNNGDNWEMTTFPQISVNTVAINGNMVFTGTQNNGVYASTNSGDTWLQTSLGSPHSITSVCVTGNNVFASTISGGIYLSTDNGVSWVQINTALPNLNTGPLLINGDYLYSGVATNGLWKRPLSELLSIKNINGEIPKDFLLSQNYPNPFNPATKIQFSLPTDAFANLTVYDILGRETAILVNENLKPGIYEADWDGSNYSGGVYYYCLTAGVYKETKKMILVK